MVPLSSYNSGKIKFYDMNSNLTGVIENDVLFVLGLNKFFWKKKKKNIILNSNKGVITYILEDLSLYK